MREERRDPPSCPVHALCKKHAGVMERQVKEEKEKGCMQACTCLFKCLKGVQRHEAKCMLE